MLTTVEKILSELESRVSYQEKFAEAFTAAQTTAIFRSLITLIKSDLEQEANEMYDHYHAIAFDKKHGFPNPIDL